MVEAGSATALIDVLDTAVKIGGGALVAGVFGWLIAKASHRNSLELAEQTHKDALAVRHFEDRRRLLLDITNYLAELETTLTGFMAQQLLYNQFPQKPAAERTKVFKVLEQRRNAFIEATRRHQGMNAQLLLLGEQGAQNKFIDYTQLIMDTFDEVSGDGSIVTADWRTEREDQIQRLEYALFGDLQEAFKRGE